MRMIDMFAGMGNMRLGFEQAGWECVYSIEFDKHKREIYKVIYGKEPEGNDITEIRGTDLPRAELWAFGAPCQDFSVAGIRAGLDGSRSGLVREVFRLVREKEPNDRPEWLLYENVKGMLSSNGGWDFAAIQAEMGELGYDVQWQLLNSKDFGVPQNRERVFTLGHLRIKGRREIFPIGEKVNGSVCQQFTDGTGIAYCLDTGYGNGISPNYVDKARRTQVIVTRDNPSQGRVYDSTGLLSNSRIRRLTPRECMRLQGVPDSITDKIIQAGISDTQMYRAAGDAVTVTVIKAIAERIIVND